jgi:hypothetical protein
MSSEIYKSLDDTYEVSKKALETTVKTAKGVAQQVKKDSGDLHTLLEGLVCMFFLGLFLSN